MTSQKLVLITKTKCGKCRHLIKVSDRIYNCVVRRQNGELTFEPRFFAEKCKLYEVKVEA